jgi:ubiquinone/menaquinone biosynthesis C-methylase UbiE
MDYVKENKAAWEEAFDIHQKGWKYDVADKLLEKDFLFLEEEAIAELRSIGLAGKTVAQFCCNNGRELLSLIKMGAQSGVGFDLAENFIQEARRIAAKVNFPCEFTAADVLKIDDHYKAQFDLVLVSIGALCWFDDLTRFFEKVALVLKENGIVVIHEIHPFTNLLAAPGEEAFEQESPEKFTYSYFRKEPMIETNGIDYIGGTQYPSKPFYGFLYTFSDLFNALTHNNISMLKLTEFNHDVSGMFGHLDRQKVPLSYLLIGRKGADRVNI